MVFGYAVKYNGVIYPTGADVPVGEYKKKEKPQTDGEKSSYSKTEISRMSTENLKTVAAELGIEVTEESTGKSLKEEIIEKLGL